MKIIISYWQEVLFIKKMIRVTADLTKIIETWGWWAGTHAYDVSYYGKFHEIW